MSSRRTSSCAACRLVCVIASRKRVMLLSKMYDWVDAFVLSIACKARATASSRYTLMSNKHATWTDRKSPGTALTGNGPMFDRRNHQSRPVLHRRMFGMVSPAGMVLDFY